MTGESAPLHSPSNPGSPQVINKGGDGGADRTNNIVLPGGQINDQSWGIHFSPLFPSNSPVSVLDPERLFYADTAALQRALDSPRVLLSEIQRYKDMVGCGTLDAGGPKTL